MKILRHIVSTVILACIIFTVAVGVKKISEGRAAAEQAQYKGVISVWQIDTFEGGKGSRRQFIDARAKEFGKANKGVLFIVSSETAESAEQKMSDGIYPDLISYGAGINIKNMLETKEYKDFPSGKIDGKTYALPWCRGGYVLIKNQNFKEEGKNLSSLIVSQAFYTLPALSLAENGYTAQTIEIKSPTEAYSLFRAGKTAYMLGTQRDVERLNGKGMNLSYIALSGFNDLYQYFSVTALTEQKRYFAESFLEYLLSEEVAKQLNGISMFSPYYAVGYSGDLEGLDEATYYKTVSAFTDSATLKNYQELSYRILRGEKDLQEKISYATILS